MNLEAEITNIIIEVDSDQMQASVIEVPTAEISLVEVQGANGANGVGVPVGGTTGQVLAKASNTNYDTEWVNQTGGGSAIEVKNEGTTITSTLASLDFVGGSVNATNIGDDVTITFLADRYKTTSTTSNTIVSNGSLTFTVDPNLSYTALQEVVIVHDLSNHMHGSVVSYSGTTLVVDIKGKTGSGTYTSWTINLDGTPVDALTGSGTANEIAYFTGGQILGSLSTATYPSLTELSYVKGVTSAIQTQLNGKVSSIVAGENITVDNTDPANPVVASSGKSDPNGTIRGTGITGDEFRYNQEIIDLPGGSYALDDTTIYHSFASGTAATDINTDGIARGYKATLVVSPTDIQTIRLLPRTSERIEIAGRLYDTYVESDVSGSSLTFRRYGGSIVGENLTGIWTALNGTDTFKIYGEVILNQANSGILVNNGGVLAEAASGDLDVSFFNNDVGYLTTAQQNIQFQDEGTNTGSSGAVSTVNFTGAGVTSSFSSGTLTVNITSGGGSGTVTSVGLAVPTGLTVSGTPITTSGTITIGLDTDRVIPTNATLNAKVNDTGDILNGAYDRTLTTLTDATSIAINLNDNNFYRVVLGGNRTLANPTNKPASGDRQVIILEVEQDGTGGRTLSFDTDYVLSVTPVLNSAANAVTHITLIATDTSIFVVGYA